MLCSFLKASLIQTTAVTETANLVSMCTVVSPAIRCYLFYDVLYSTYCTYVTLARLDYRE